MTFLNLSANWIGYINSEGTIGIGKGLLSLAQLEVLDLSNNAIGNSDYLGAIALGEGLAQLKNLTYFKFFNNRIGLKGVNGTVSIGQGLSSLSRLTFLDLSSNFIELRGAEGSLMLTKAISSLKNITALDLSHNYIGYKQPNSSIELGSALRKAEKLENVNLGYNQIGSTGPEGPDALIPVLLNLPKLKLENLNVQGMSNISWTQAASYLQNRQSQAMMEACQASQCFGGDIHVNSKAPQSLAIDAPAMSNPVNATVTHESRALVVYEDQAPQASSDMVSTLGVSALTGAAFAALPEAVGDALYLSGLVSDVNASRVKIATNAALVFATGSWLPVGASLATSAVLQRAGVSEPTSRLAGNAAAFFINAGRSLTPTGFAAMAVNYAAGKAGLLLEKYTMKRVFGGASLSVGEL